MGELEGAHDGRGHGGVGRGTRWMGALGELEIKSNETEISRKKQNDTVAFEKGRGHTFIPRAFVNSCKTLTDSRAEMSCDHSPFLGSRFYSSPLSQPTQLRASIINSENEILFLKQEHRLSKHVATHTLRIRT